MVLFGYCNQKSLAQSVRKATTCCTVFSHRSSMKKVKHSSFINFLPTYNGLIPSHKAQQISITWHQVKKFLFSRVFNREASLNCLTVWKVEKKIYVCLCLCLFVFVFLCVCSSDLIRIFLSLWNRWLKTTLPYLLVHTEIKKSFIIFVWNAVWRRRKNLNQLSQAKD